MSTSIVRHRLALLVRLIDASGGKLLKERDVKFFTFEQGKEVRLNLAYKEPGTYILLGAERNDFVLYTKAYGYEESQVQICYAGLSNLLPAKTIFLMQKPSKSNYGRLYRLEGHLEGIESVEGIRLAGTFLKMQGYNEETHVLTVYNPRKRAFLQEDYGAVDLENNTYTRIYVKNVRSPEEIEVDGGSVCGSKFNTPILPVIFGYVDNIGNYRFRADSEGTEEPFIIRYQVKGKEKYMLHKFQNAKDVMTLQDKEGEG